MAPIAAVVMHRLVGGTVRQLECTDGSLCLVCLDGETELTDRYGQQQLSAGAMAVRVAPWQGKLVSGAGVARSVMFRWSTAQLEAMGPLAAGAMRPRTIYGRSSVELAWRAVAELRNRDPLSPHALRLFAEGVALGLSRQLLHAQPDEHHLATQARELIDADLTVTFSLTAYAKSIGCAPAHLSRVFRKLHGIPPREYQLRRRIERARHLLTATEKSTCAIGTELGFHDTAHFTRHFRKLTGVTPAGFRKGQR